MQILHKIVRIVIAAILLATAVYLGFQSVNDKRFVVWFGLASAILVPLAIALLSSLAQSKDKDLIRSLSKVPEIDRLVASANTETEKLRLLQQERSKLGDTIKIEARRLSLLNRRSSLESEAARMIAELDNIRDELSQVDEASPDSHATAEIRQMGERIRARDKGDLIIRFGSRFYSLDRDIVKALPLGTGEMILALARVFELAKSKRE